MSINLRFEKRDGYLFVQVIGVFVYHDAISALNNTLEEAGSHRTTKILIDGFMFQNAASTFDLYNFVIYLADKTMKFADRYRTMMPQIAFVTHGPLKNPEHFSDIVATNRGARVHSFDNSESALKWLDVSPSGDQDKNDHRVSPERQ